MRRISRLFLVIFVVSVSSARLLQAQGAAPTLRKLNFDAGASIAPEDYGVQGVTYTVIPASDFRPFDSSTGYITDFNTSVSRTGGGGQFFSHEIQLPPGAILIDITAYASDTSATANVDVYLELSFRDSGTGLNPGGGYYVMASSSGAPGKTAIVVSWNSTLPALSGTQELSYLVLIALNASDNTNSFNSVRLKWKRQISPDPATATFADVPVGHPFHRFVEALAASGITGGCGNGNYCPDAPITRGQMAVFLSAALGLHWAP